MAINTKATHENRSNGKKRIVERVSDEKGQMMIVRNMRGKVLKIYRRRQMNKFNAKYISLAIKKRDKRTRDLD